MPSTRILGIAGSLRKGSFNRAALRAAQALAPAGAEIEVFELAGIPVFDADQERTPPERVAEFKARIRASDAILFVTPEYNYSVPGVLKNAIDWASRPSGDGAWGRKPAAIMGASNGMFGSARAQYHLRQVLVSLNMPTVSSPEVMIAKAQERFDASGALTDEATAQHIRRLLVALVELAGLHAPREGSSPA